MAFASMDDGNFGDDAEPLAEINMVPLIDVMLVLLIIFMVTAPLLTHAVKLDLPHASSAVTQTPPEHLQVAIDADLQLYWAGVAVSASELSSRLQEAAARQPQPELHLRAARTTPYENVAQVMSEAARLGLSRIGLITDPSPAH